MESHHRETEFARRISQQSPMDGFSPMDCGTGSPMSDDSFSLSALLNLDNYPELCSPFSYASASASPFSYSAFRQISSNWASLASPNAHSAEMDDLDGISPAQRTAILSNSPRANGSGNFTSADADADDESMSSLVPKSLPGVSLAERMLRALSLFKESSGGGILAQVWMPIKRGDGYVLSTSEQPFLLDQILAGYREVSREFTFSAEETPGLYPGLPGRVFISGFPEWTPSVVYYLKPEYLRSEFARSHEVRGSLAMPIFDTKERLCCAVLELVMTKEKSDFDLEMDSICNALQAVDLRTIKGQAHQQSLSMNQKSACNEILDVLRACCQAHLLPLALTWVPFSFDGERVPDGTREVVKELNANLRKKSLLRIEDSACYVNDTRMKGFLHACAEQCLEKGQGIAGKALQSNHPFFSPDVKGYGIREYPLAHHARKYGLNASVAIRLRSTFTGNDDYILEFFLPVNCRGSSEQQELLNNLSSTMQRICRSLRTVSDAEVVAADSAIADIQKHAGTSSSSPEISIKHSQQLDSDNEVLTDLPFEDSNTRSGERDGYHEQSGSTRQPEKKRSTAEKNISTSVLQQYFSGSLKDAAKSIGVCPTTLKRICRQHGISRWPSRKINKVNRSLKKIQTVIDSVQGVEGSLKYDPTTGCLVAAVSAEKSTTMTLEKASRDAVPSSSTPDAEPERFVAKLELDDSLDGRDTVETSCFPNVHKCETDRACLHQTKWSSKQCTFTSDARLSRQPDMDGISVWSFDSKDASQRRYIAKDRSCRGLSSGSMATDDVNPKADINRMKEHSHPSSSSMTDSSSGSASSVPTFKKSSMDTVLAADTDGGATTITVKATYKEDTVRFKFIPSSGCQQLFEEIAKRYKLAIGTFRIKYMDDEEEWVMLSSDADLIECVEVLESVGSRNLKLLVRDVPWSFGSSGGSNFLQA